MRTADIYLNGLGIYLPETVSIKTAVEQGLYSAESVERHGWTGCAVAGDISAPEMALQASRQALERCGRDPKSLDLLLYADCWHQGPDGWQPQAYLQHYLVGGDLLAVEIHHGCNGTFSALELAASYLNVQADRSAALVVASDNFGTPLLDRWNPGPGFVASDAAAALVVTKEPGFAQLLSVNSITVPEVEEIHRCGEPMFPPGATTGRVVDFSARLDAFRAKLFTSGAGMEAASQFHQKTQECVQKTLTEAGIKLSDITRVVITNCSKEEAEVEFMGVLGLPLSMSSWEYGRTIGHMGAGDHAISLHHLLETGQLVAGDHVLMIGTAPGITYSCAAVKILGGLPNLPGPAGPAGTEILRETVREDIAVDLPTDAHGSAARTTAPARYIDVDVPSATDPDQAHRWTALFVAFLHRYTTADRIHLIAGRAGGEGLDVRSIPVSGGDTVGELTARVEAGLRDPATPVRLVERVRSADDPCWSARVLAGLPGSGPAGEDAADIRLDLSGPGVVLRADEALWSRPAVERMAEHLGIMAAAARAETPVAELPMLAPAERDRMLVGWNDTARDWPETDYVELLRGHARSRPGASALVHDARTVTFGELESESNRIARRLARSGARPGERIGLLCPTSAQFVIAAVGILKTGAAIVPLDPVNPDPRVAFMIADSAPLAVLTTDALFDRAVAVAPVGTVPTLVIGSADFAEESDEPTTVEITGRTISHLIYTSGSTGEPKAVLERHAALVNLVHWTESAYGVKAGDRASWLSTPGFAVQLMEWMPYLALGIPIHVGEAANRSPEQLRDWLVDQGVTHTMLVAALAERVWALDWPAGAPLRILVTTAERVHSWPPTDSAFQVVMTYGSTETTNVLSCLDLGAGSDFTAAATPAEVRAVRPVPVGRPIANLRVYLLDPAGRPVPVGVVGRLHVAGAGLAAGYHRRPELSAAKFAANPLPEEPDEVLYDTGDLARYRADGAVELLGRSDSQVKIRGFRVELGEVESALRAAPGVHEAVVVTYEPTPGDVRLAAYVAAAADDPPPVGVRSHVTEHLPHYMVPSVVVPLAELPRLPNGKVDRQRLPAPEISFRDGLGTAFVAPDGAAQQELARIWSEVLRLDQVGSQDNFFELGGHSVLAVQMVGRAGAAFDVPLRLPDLCAHPTVAALATLIAETKASAEPPEAKD